MHLHSASISPHGRRRGHRSKPSSTLRAEGLAKGPTPGVVSEVRHGLSGRPLDAGANAEARDSEGAGVDFYLDNNPRLSATDRALGVRGLAKIAGRFAGPSFDCAKAHTAAERSICASEVLRILDTQIARAFEAVRGDLVPSALQEQRAWLHERDQSCSASNDTDCLAELMRTHLRYLHKRLAEKNAPMMAAKATQ